MRSIIYAAGAYALLFGTTTHAFAPQTVGTGTCSGRGCSTGERTPNLMMGMDGSSRWAAPVGYVPASSKPDQVDSIIGNSAMTVAAPFESSFAAPASADSNKWTPPSGYVPGGSPAAQTQAVANSMAKSWQPSGDTPNSPAEKTADVMARVSEMLGSQPTPASTAKSWAPPTGYLPGSAASASRTDKKWQPCKHPIRTLIF